jgi:cytochrome P450
MAFSAGHETTAGLIGGAIGYLAGQAELRAQLRSAPASIPHAVQELLRLTSPIQYVEYSTNQACDVGSKTIPAGDRVALIFSVANRDPRAFDCPHEFQTERDLSHLAFGAGRHRCPGAQLATIEAEETLRALLARLDFSVVDAGLQWSDMQFIHRPTQLLCRVARVEDPSPG